MMRAEPENPCLGLSGAAGALPAGAGKKARSACPKFRRTFLLLDGLEQRGFLSAARMVEHVIHMRKSRFGSQRIVHELREKGIQENLIAAALPNLKEAEQRKRVRSMAEKVRCDACRCERTWQANAFSDGAGFTAGSDTAGCCAMLIRKKREKGTTLFDRGGGRYSWHHAAVVAVPSARRLSTKSIHPLQILTARRSCSMAW